MAYRVSVNEPEEFWAAVAENFQWRKKWDKVLEWNFKEPHIEWFQGGKLNITENCIDRHLKTMGEKPAFIWEPNNPEERTRIVTYNRLHKRVCQVAQMLKNNGVKKGDRVCIYMGMVPELVYAILGCARIGAIHSVIFGGFSAQSIADRLEDAQAEYIITCDGAYRGGKDIPLKSVIDDALVGNKKVKNVIVYTRTRTPVSMIKGRDLWWERRRCFISGGRNGCRRSIIYFIYFRQHRQTKRCCTFQCRLYAVDHLHFCKRVSIHAWTVIFLYSRYWMDNRPQLYHLWSVVCRSYFPDV
jgi:acetyl-CoA synthetase